MFQRIIGYIFLVSVCLSTVTTNLILEYDTFIILVTGIISLVGLICSSYVILQLRRIDILFFVTILYGLINQRVLNFDLIVRYVSFVLVWFYFRNSAYSKLNSYLFYGIIFTAIGHSIVAVLQFFRLFSNINYYFDTTGLFNNPGPYGCYLSFALSAYLPHIFVHFKQYSRLQKYVTISVLLLLLCGLLLSESRAAYISLMISITLFIIIRFYPIIKRRIFCTIALLSVIIGLVSFLYVHRPSSANARLQIWKVCGFAIKDKPLFGYGTGSYRKIYMFKQADYLRNAPENTRRNADQVNTAYNLPLELLFEQGVVGLLLWGTILLLSIKSMFLDNKHAPPVYMFSVISFIVFALFSYPHLIWGLMCPFISYVSIGCKREYICKCPNNTCRYICFVLKYSILVFFLFFVGIRIQICNNLNKYYNLEIDRLEVESCKIYNIVLNHSPGLLSIYAGNQMSTADYGASIATYAQLGKYRNSYHFEKNLAYSYEVTGDTINAVFHYNVAQQMCPGYLEPLFSKFLIYESKCDSMANHFAKEVIDFTPKIRNAKTDAMKNRASQYMRYQLIDYSKKSCETLDEKLEFFCKFAYMTYEKK